MKTAIFADNGLGKWFAQLFDQVPDVAFYISEDNRAGSNVTDRQKVILSRKREIRMGLRHPFLAYSRLKENAFDNKRDFHFFELEEAVKQGKFDVAITKSDRSLHTLAELKRRHNNFKLVYWIPFTIPFVDIFDDRSFAIRMRSFDQIDHFIAITETCKRTLEFEGLSSERITTIYPGINLERFSPAKMEKSFRHLPAGKYNLLFVGKLVSWKGCFSLVYALKLLAAEIPEVHLTMVGGGAQKERLLKVAELLGVSDRLALIGSVPYDSMQEYYHEADLFVLPSLPAINLAEQFGYVVAEAMACGLPTIVSRVGGLPEVVGEQDALIFNPGDYHDLARKVLNLYLDEGAYNSARDKCIALARNRYCANVNGKRIYQLISSI